MMNHITIIDSQVGDPTGFCVRIGPEQGFNRLAGCSVVANTTQVYVYASFHDAYNDAIRFSKMPENAGLTIRANCTLPK